MRSDIPPSRSRSDGRISVREVFYISNLLSLARIVLVPFIVYHIVHHRRGAALVFGSLAVLSDGLDGYFARRLNQHTDLGKVLDPIADKIAIAAVILGLIVSHDGFPVWAFALIALRDVLIILGGVVLFRRKRIISRSNRWGKCTSFFLSISLMLYVFGVQGPIPFYLLCIGLVFALISSWSYSRRLFRLLQTEPSPPKKPAKTGD